MSKRKVRIRRARAHLALLPEDERRAHLAALDDEAEEDELTRHILLPSNTERLDDERKEGSKWNKPLFTPPKSSNYLINGKSKYFS